MSELYIPIERPTRNLVNGRFLKGHTPHNKGKKLKFHSRWSKRRCLKNLEKGRSMPHKTSAGMNRKSVVAIKNRQLFAVYPSSNDAGRKTGVCSRNIRSCCSGKRKSAGGYQWFLESDNTWCDLVNMEE